MLMSPGLVVATSFACSEPFSGKVSQIPASTLDATEGTTLLNSRVIVANIVAVLGSDFKEVPCTGFSLQYRLTPTTILN